MASSFLPTVSKGRVAQATALMNAAIVKERKGYEESAKNRGIRM